MRTISPTLIINETARLCIEAAYKLPDDTTNIIKKALKSEKNDRAKYFLHQYLENAKIAKNENIPICQDTGIAVFFVELGNKVYIPGGIEKAISRGTEKGYKKGLLRMSIVSDPVFDRKNTGTNTPPTIHISLVKGEKLKISLALKGGGSENMSALAMLKPSDGIKGICNFVADTVIKAGGNPCPPTIVGVGIGGNLEVSAILAKKALFRKIGTPNTDKRYAMLEKRILDRINKSGVGSQGLGGSITSFAVHIEWLPCHMASLPVAVNLNCHASRHKEVII